MIYTLVTVIIIITWHFYCALNMLCTLKDAGQNAWPASWGMLQRHFLLLGRGQSLNPIESSALRPILYLNGAKLRLSDLHNDDSWCRTAGCSLTSYPRTKYWTLVRDGLLSWLLMDWRKQSKRKKYLQLTGFFSLLCPQSNSSADKRLLGTERFMDVVC